MFIKLFFKWVPPVSKVFSFRVIKCSWKLDEALERRVDETRKYYENLFKLSNPFLIFLSRNEKWKSYRAAKSSVKKVPQKRKAYNGNAVIHLLFSILLMKHILYGSLSVCIHTYILLFTPLHICDWIRKVSSLLTHEIFLTNWWLTKVLLFLWYLLIRMELRYEPAEVHNQEDNNSIVNVARDISQINPVTYIAGFLVPRKLDQFSDTL